MLPEIACVMDWSATANFFKDAIVSGAAVFTAYVAYKGISKWRNEEAGKADFELSRRIGKSIFRLRDVIANARRNLVTRGEYPEDYQDGNASDDEKGEAWAHLFDARWIPVRDCALEIQSLRNEAEALWGREIVGYLDKVLGHAHTLRGAMGAYVGNEQSGGEDFKMDSDFGKRIRTQVFDTGYTRTTPGDKPEPNLLTSAIETDVDAASAYLRTKLPHKV